MRKVPSKPKASKWASDASGAEAVNRALELRESAAWWADALASKGLAPEDRRLGEQRIYLALRALRGAFDDAERSRLISEAIRLSAAAYREFVDEAELGERRGGPKPVGGTPLVFLRRSPGPKRAPGRKRTASERERFFESAIDSALAHMRWADASLAGHAARFRPLIAQAIQAYAESAGGRGKLSNHAGNGAAHVRELRKKLSVPIKPSPRKRA